MFEDRYANVWDKETFVALSKNLHRALRAPGQAPTPTMNLRAGTHALDFSGIPLGFESSGADTFRVRVEIDPRSEEISGVVAPLAGVYKPFLEQEFSFSVSNPLQAVRMITKEVDEFKQMMQGRRESSVRDELIKLGSKHRELRPHIRPLLAAIEGRTQTGKRLEAGMREALNHVAAVDPIVEKARQTVEEQLDAYDSQIEELEQIQFKLEEIVEAFERPGRSRLRLDDVMDTLVEVDVIEKNKRNGFWKYVIESVLEQEDNTAGTVEENYASLEKKLLPEIKYMWKTYGKHIDRRRKVRKDLKEDWDRWDIRSIYRNGLFTQEEAEYLSELR